MQKVYNTEVLIIGSGPAGYSAAIYAARSALEPILVSGQQPGDNLQSPLMLKITLDLQKLFKVHGLWRK